MLPEQMAVTPSPFTTSHVLLSSAQATELLFFLLSSLSISSLSESQGLLRCQCC